MVGPSRPSSPISLIISRSKRSWRFASRIRGISLSWQYCRAVSRIRRSSSLSWSSSSSGSSHWNSARPVGEVDLLLAETAAPAPCAAFMIDSGLVDGSVGAVLSRLGQRPNPAPPPLAEPADLGAAAANPHVAPAAGPAPRFIEKEPAAVRSGALLQAPPVQIDQQLCGRQGNRPQHGAPVIRRCPPSPGEASRGLGNPAGGGPAGARAVQLLKRSRPYPAAAAGGGEDSVDGFAQVLRLVEDAPGVSRPPPGGPPQTGSMGG